LRICLVANEVIGPFINGGIGTTTTGLAQWLATEGHEVTILYTLRDGARPFCAVKTFEFWQSTYSTEWHIDLVALQDPDGVDPSLPPALRTAYAVHQWVAARTWHMVVFSDVAGLGYFCVQAKRCGTQYHRTTLVVVAHGSHRWVRSVDETVSDDPNLFVMDDLEETALAFCDVVVSPSAYMLDWMSQSFGDQASRRLQIRNLLPKNATAPPPPSESRCVPIDEIVFFGRLEIRKGIEIFCDAMDRLAVDSAVQAKLRKVTFLGRCGRIGGEHAAAYVLRRSYDWPFELKYEISADQDQALHYLRSGKRLAVMPSVADNLPSVVIECLENGIPFLAGRVGGAAELVAPADHRRVLIEPEVQPVADAIRVLGAGGWIARPAITRDQAIVHWRRLIAETEAETRKPDRVIRPRSRMRVPQSGGLLDLGGGRHARILMEPGVQLEPRGLEVLMRGLRDAPVVTTVWLEDGLIRAPRLDRGALLTQSPALPVCAFDADLAAHIDQGQRSADVCRQLILEGHHYLVVPEPWCTARADETVPTSSLGHLRLGERARLDGAALILGRDFARRRSELLQKCYETVPSGDVLGALDTVDNFGDVRSTLEHMVSFLDGVGRRREARALFETWKGMAPGEREQGRSINVTELMRPDAVTLENILISGGFEPLEDRSFRLHPNAPSHPDASCALDLCLFGHAQLKGTLEIRNSKSAPVEFQIELLRNGSVLRESTHVVNASRPIEFKMSFDPVIGPVRLKLSTRMADGLQQNSFAWATWRHLEFLPA
jgi:glycosyltransferase involved in cell wall biosynthesis